MEQVEGPGIRSSGSPGESAELEEPEPCKPDTEPLEDTMLPSEPEVATGTPEPSERPAPGLPTTAPAVGEAGEEPVSGGAEAVPRPLATAASGSKHSEEKEKNEEEEEKEREALLAELRELASERDALRQRGARLQLRLGELLRREPSALLRREAEAGPELYAQRLRELLELRKQREEVAAACKERVSARQRVAEERQAQAQALWAQFQARKKAVAVRGRRLAARTVAAKALDLMQALEWDKEQRVREARVENIRLKHEIQNLEIILKAQGEGQRFMDFEYMKKENQKNSKKIDDLSAEILKLKKKVSNTVLILSQFREKLQFVEAENEARKAELMGTVNILSQKRDILTKTKQARDRLWTNNLKLQQNCGLLGNEILLQDFEKTVDTVEILSGRLETLKHHHADLILASGKIQKKIKEANSSFFAEGD